LAHLKAVAVGAGYFSQYHYEAWARMPDVELSAICDLDARRAEQAAARFGVARHFTDYRRMLDAEQPDFVDIITRPDSHVALAAEAAARGVHLLCQKPLAPTFALARQLVENADRAGVRLMVHDNFRFQPWYR
jgi:predicted dehydrogenase